MKAKVTCNNGHCNTSHWEFSNILFNIEYKKTDILTGDAIVNYMIEDRNFREIWAEGKGLGCRERETLLATHGELPSYLS